MAREKGIGKGARKKVKKAVQTNKKDPQVRHNEEIISEEELNKRGGISGGTTAFLTSLLGLFFDGAFHYQHSKKLVDLATFIYDRKILYTPKQGGYKLMEISSIYTEIAQLSKAVKKQREEKKEEERKEAEKFKSRY